MIGLKEPGVCQLPCREFLVEHTAYQLYTAEPIQGDSEGRRLCTAVELLLPYLKETIKHTRMLIHARVSKSENCPPDHET